MALSELPGPTSTTTRASSVLDSLALEYAEFILKGFQHNNAFATEGLCTLLCGSRFVSRKYVSHEDSVEARSRRRRTREQHSRYGAAGRLPAGRQHGTDKSISKTQEDAEGQAKCREREVGQE